MPASKKYAQPPPEPTGFQIFIRVAYATRYNFAVANYNAVATNQKKSMFGDLFLLYRSVVAVVWIVAMAFAALALFKAEFVTGAVIPSVIYLAISIYNLYVYIDNRSLLHATRLLRAKVAGPSGLDCEWVSVPLDSRSANERLAAVEQAAIDRVRQEYAGSNVGEVECMVYTSRYADQYPSFPKEALLHILAFLVAIAFGGTMAAIL